MKHSRRGLSKKGLRGLVRKNNVDGKRMWFYKGNEYETLRSVVVSNWMDQLGLLRR